MAAFFRERVFLPQSLLSQLLQIYQESGHDTGSPLARFVGELLELGRLDALEIGLKPLADIRNVRKTVDGWLTTENEKSRLDRLLMDQRKARTTVNEQVQAALTELATLCTTLQLSVEVREDALDAVATALADSTDSDAFERLADQQRRLGSIRREIDAAKSVSTLPPSVAVHASALFARSEVEHGPRVEALRQLIGALLSDVSFPSDLERLAQEALARLKSEHKQLMARASQARADIVRQARAQDEREIALQQRAQIDDELGRLSSSGGSLGSPLAEFSSFISGDTCPLCDRDFSELKQGSLIDHVHTKVRVLSASAERLLTLGRLRSEVQATSDRLDREIEMISARIVDPVTLAEIDRRIAAIDFVVTELESMSDALREGGQLRNADVASRRTVSDAQSRNVALVAARETLSTFAVSIGAPEVAEGEVLRRGGGTARADPRK